MKSRLKPHQIVVVIGVLFALVTVVSGITATTLQWHDDSTVQRHVLENIPSAWRLIFYTVFPILIVYGSVLFSQRVRNWERGAPDRRATTKKNAGRRLKDFRDGVYMKTLLRDPAAGIMHSLIYFSFLQMTTPVDSPYAGKYQGQAGPTASAYHREFGRGGRTS